MKMTPETAFGLVNHGDEVISELAKAYLALWAANRNLYYAAHWEADREVVQPEKLWEDIRDICGFPPGHSPKKIEPLPLGGGEDYTSDRLLAECRPLDHTSTNKE